MFRRVPLASLDHGLVLASPIFENGRKVLLKAGVPLTHDLVQSLYKRNVRSVAVTDADFRRITAFSARGKSRAALPPRTNAQTTFTCEATDELDRQLIELAPCRLPSSDEPFCKKIDRHAAVRYDPAHMAETFDEHHRACEQVRDLVAGLGEGEAFSAEAARHLLADALERAAQDLDLFVCMGINPLEANSIYAHSMNVATLAVAVGATLGLDHSSLCDLGIGCLVHDAGMLKVDKRLSESPRILSDAEFVEIAKHPVISADLLHRSVKAVPTAVRMIAYQTHERCNGSGYPRGVTSEKIHPLSKIAAVADAYVALVSPRPHRHAMLPYRAMAKMLHDVRGGLFDSAIVRALLQTVSLFPTGSFVELSDGRVGKTIRANGHAYHRPILEVWWRTHLSAPPEIVDLCDRFDLEIAKPLTERR
jgi:HD-GYP domain-containing protein (c-di-GMP phosphodiesterase class II)